MNSNKLTLIAGGCNSQLYAYGRGEEQVALKVVSGRNRKEQAHLRNEYQVLQSLSHRNVIRAHKYRENVVFEGNKTDK